MYSGHEVVLRWAEDGGQTSSEYRRSRTSTSTRKSQARNSWRRKLSSVASVTASWRMGAAKGEWCSMDMRWFARASMVVTRLARSQKASWAAMKGLRGRVISERRGRRRQSGWSRNEASPRVMLMKILRGKGSVSGGWWELGLDLDLNILLLRVNHALLSSRREIEMLLGLHCSWWYCKLCNVPSILFEQSVLRDSW